MGEPHSGKFGVVNGHSTVRNWQVTDSMAPAKWVASNTQGGTGRSRGVQSWQGSFAGYGGLPAVMPAEFFDFQGYTAPDDDVSGDGAVYEGNAIVDSVQINWNWANAEPINWTINFSGNGALDADGLDEFTDDSVPTIYEPCGVHLAYSRDDLTSSGQSSPFTNFEKLTQASLTISAANQSYVNSDTDCWTGKKPGVIDWTASITEQRAGRLAAIAKGNSLDLRFFIDASPSQFWGLRWGLVRDFSGLNVDRESGAIIQRTINLDMRGFLGSDVGFIMKPGEAAPWWPFS